MTGPAGDACGAQIHSPGASFVAAVMGADVLAPWAWARVAAATRRTTSLSAFERIGRPPCGPSPSLRFAEAFQERPLRLENPFCRLVEVEPRGAIDFRDLDVPA